MRIPRELRLGEPGQANCFHVVSRVVDRNLVFGDEEKEFFRSLLERQLRFSGLRCLAWCFMGNHFHLLLEVPDKEAALENGQMRILLAVWGCWARSATRVRC